MERGEAIQMVIQKIKQGVLKKFGLLVVGYLVNADASEAMVETAFIVSSTLRKYER